ncbi:MAG: DUF4192 domain-containing protein [Micromonosporaceae bacterium]
MQGQIPVKIGSPEEVVAAIPYLLGFHPTRSLVVIGARPPRDRVHVSFRYDLLDPPEDGYAREIARHAAEVLVNQQITVAIVAGYGPGALVTPIAEEFRRHLTNAGVELREMLRVEDGRFWSYLCADPGCCPAEGVPFDVSISPVAAQMTLAGNVTLPDRAALEKTLAPLDGVARTSMRQATMRAENRAAAMVAEAARSGRRRREILRPVVDEGLRAVSLAIGTYRGGERITSDDEIAWLTITLADLRVRDDAWARMDPAYADAHQRLWTDVICRAEPRYVPAPACLLAFTAWQSGNGALANIAIARALESDPGYTMARLLAEAVGGGLPPSAARLPMSPEEVAASYAAPEGRRKPARRRPSA